MMTKRIALHTFNLFNTEAMISTVQFTDSKQYETMVMFEDGDELESFTTNDLSEAVRVHKELVKKYNDRIYNGTPKLLGAKNYGQFVTAVVDC